MEKNMSLKKMLNEKCLSFAMESHNAITAKIAESVGFKAVWASGLSISATMGLADRNEASWTQVLEVAEHMADHIDIPILFDGDSGFGDYNNVSRLVRKLGQRGVSGLCIEDKLFPKKNSFIGEAQELEDVAIFCGKLRAAKDFQVDDNFVVVARVEALVSGRSMNEAFDRASSYCEAGADAILIHSKQSDGDEIIEFANRWKLRKPLVIVPTKYFSRPTSEYVDKVSLIIWANHALRTSVASVRNVMERIMRDASVAGVEKDIATLEEIFSLTNEKRIKEIEQLGMYGK